jgi:hypothetical protein
MDKKIGRVVIGSELRLLATLHGDHGGGALSGEQRPEKVLQGSWRGVVRERGGVGGFCEGEEWARVSFYSRAEKQRVGRAVAAANGGARVVAFANGRAEGDVRAVLAANVTWLPSSEGRVERSMRTLVSREGR